MVEKNVFVEKNLNLIKSLAKEYSDRYRLNYDDLYSEGCLALVEVRNKFDPKRGNSNSLVRKAIKNKMIDYIRKVKKDEKKTLSLYMESDEDDTPLIERLEDKSIKLIEDEIIEHEERKEKNKLAHKIFDRLKPNEKFIYQKKLRTSYKNLSKKLKISPERIRQIKKKAERKIKSSISKDLRKELKNKGILELVVFVIWKCGLLPEEFKVGERIGDKDLKNLLLNLEKEEEYIRNNEMFTEKEKERELKDLENFRFMLQRTYDQVKELKIRGDHIFWPSKTKPKRDNVFEAVTYLRAIFKEVYDSYRWDLIEEIIMAYCPEVFRGGNIESWYYKREKEEFKYWPIKVEEREKFFLKSLKKEFNYFKH